MILRVGRIGRAHGLKGEVLVTLTTDLTAERTAPGAVFLLSGERSDLPETLVVAKAHPQQQDKWRIKFEGVDDRNAADRLRNLDLSAESISDTEDVFVHELVGKNVVEADGASRGEVLSLISNPASDLLELDSGHLVPMAFYVSHDDETVTVEVPDGLWDL